MWTVRFAFCSLLYTTLRPTLPEKDYRNLTRDLREKVTVIFGGLARESDREL